MKKTLFVESTGTHLGLVLCGVTETGEALPPVSR
jgi:hypothetical protein